jgi:hypothetical protein
VSVWVGFWVLGVLAFVASICSAYWFGKDAGTREAYKWRTRYEHQRRENSLLRQTMSAPFESAWNNVRVVPDESYDAS